MRVFVTVSSLLIAFVAFGAEAPSRKEMELELRAVQAEKERYLAELSYGQRLVDDAQRNLPAKFLRERELLDALRRTEEKPAVP